MTLVIAEAGVNHNGDFKLATRLVDAAHIAGADIVKFQTFQAHQVNAKAQIDREQDKYIEDRFYEARANKSKINDLGRELQNFGRFHEFEDRFYALLREC